MMYRGEQYDSDLGLYYLRARYYNPLTGRFMSRDPNDPQLIDNDGNPTDPRYLHKYLYANGDPENGIDPTGKLAIVDYAINFVKRYSKQIIWAKACGLSIWDLYSTISDALENAYQQPGHKYVPAWKVISKVWEVYAACAGPAIIQLYRSY